MAPDTTSTTDSFDGLHKYEWRQQKDGTWARKASGNEMPAGMAFTDATGRQMTVQECPQGSSVVVTVAIVAPHALTLADFQHAWRAVRHRFPNVGCTLGIHGVTDYSLQYQVPTEAEARDWSKRTTRLIEQHHTSDQLFDYLFVDSAGRLRDGFVELFISPESDRTRWSIGVRGCHALIDGHGGFVILDALLRALVNPTSEPHWGDEPSRLGSVVAVTLGRRQEQLSEDGRAYLEQNERGKGGEKRAFRFCRNSAPRSDEPDSAAISQLLPATETETFLTACKSRGLTVGEALTAIWPLALYLADPQPVSVDSVASFILPLDLRRWDKDTPTVSATTITSANYSMADIESFAIAYRAKKPFAPAFFTHSQKTLQRLRDDKRLALYDAELVEQLLPSIGPGGLMLSLVAPVDKFISPTPAAGWSVSGPRVGATMPKESFFVVCHVYTFQGEMRVQACAGSGTQEISKLQALTDCMVDLMRHLALI